MVRRFPAVKFGNVVVFLLLLLIGFLFIAPFIWILLTSFKTTDEVYSVPLTILPNQWVLDQYVTTLTQMSGFPTYFMNSIIVTGATLFLVMVFSPLAGFALARMNFFGQSAVLMLLLIVMSLPWGIYLIPIYILQDFLGLLNTHIGLVLPYVALSMPMSVYICRGAFKGVPREIEEAGKIDGCTPFSLWFRIMLPMVVPSLSTAAIMTYILVWGEFMFARTLASRPHMATVPVGIMLLQVEGRTWPYGTLSAIIVITIIPVFLIFVALQRYIVRGLTEGALKG